MALVYLATNLVNGKRYVGITAKALEQRAYNHIYRAAAAFGLSHNWLRKAAATGMLVAKTGHHYRFVPKGA